ncbi:hypothetical protein NA57DRAFT_20670, partial [Rhizodiscina lignyota]
IDESIYDYDSFFDAKQARENEPKKKKDNGKPKYMADILAANEVRKKDQLRARDKLLQRQREEEGDQFMDKEKFVTEAYKKQQEEVRQAEEEERRKEEAEAAKKQKGEVGMRSFYKDLLGRDEEKHRAIVEATADIKDKRKQPDEEQETVKSEADIARELNKKGASIYINDDGQVSDKRELLGAGLNVMAKPNAAAPAAAAVQARSLARPQAAHGRGSSDRERRMRQTRMVEAQLEEMQRKAAEAEETGQKKAEQEAQSKKTKEEIKSARERYLQRK